jgi:thiamine-phosphate pyrophosphorylase
LKEIICLVTGGGAPAAILSRIREAAAAGIDLIQIREPWLDDRTLLTLTSEAVDAVQTTACRVVVNDRLDIALAANAPGVHLRGNSFSAARVRASVPRGFLVGRSVHGVDEARAAAASGCDYLIFGTIFPSRSKPPGHPAVGLDALRKVSQSVQIPVVAIGGICVDNAAAAVAAGAAGVAGIELFQGPQPPGEVVARLRRSFDT